MTRIIVVRLFNSNTFLSAVATAEITTTDINASAFSEIPITGKNPQKIGITIKITVE